MAVPEKNREFTVALTADFKLPDGGPRFPSFDLDLLQRYNGVRLRMFDEHRPEIGADQVGDAQGVIVLAPKVMGQTLACAENLLVIGRFGVGYDSVDVAACTESDVAVFITVGAVDRSVAEATIGWMLALTHHILPKDRLVREGRWDDRSQWMGCELRDRTLGIVGLGGIGRALVQLVDSFGMSQIIAFDPLVSPTAAESIGVKLVSLDQLLATADFVTIHCPLNSHTQNLIGVRELGLMKPGSYLINTARGGIVDEDALFNVLAEKRIAGAAIDCFVGEPINSPHRFGVLDNVLLAPHCISWTEELFRDIGNAACRGMLDIACGRQPSGVLNPQVFARPTFQQKWARLRIEG
jgi:phosphoglycerate dehydrogenase-like enzyme